MPKSFISKRKRLGYGDPDDVEDKNPLIIRPEIDFDLPDFVARADEILEAEIEAELEKIRILNKTEADELEVERL